MERGLIYALSVWRLAHMVAREDGPGGVFRWLRDDVHPAGLPREVVKGLRCVSCVSIWAAGLLLLVPGWLRLLLAGSAVAKLLEDYLYETPAAVDPLPEEEVWGDYFPALSVLV